MILFGQLLRRVQRGLQARVPGPARGQAPADHRLQRWADVDEILENARTTEPGHHQKLARLGQGVARFQFDDLGHRPSS